MTVTYLSHTIHKGTEPRGEDFVVQHQYGDGGAHRLALIGPGAPGRNFKVGEWATYQAVAELQVDGHIYLGFTEFFGERVIEARPLAQIKGASKGE